MLGLLFAPVILASLAVVTVVGGAAVVWPALVPLSLVLALLDRSLLALAATQLLCCTPFLGALLGRSSLICTMLCLISVVCAPAWAVRAFVSCTLALAPFVCAASSLVATTAAQQVSRHWSAEAGDAEDRHDEKAARTYKTLILVASGVSFLLAIRWLFLAFTITDDFSSTQAGQLFFVLVVANYLTLRCVSTRRAVLSEAAIVSALLSLAFFQFALSMTTDQERDEWMASDRESWLLDRLLPIALDAAALAVIALELLTDDEQDTPASTGASSSSSPSSSPSSASASASASSSQASIHLYRVGAILLIAHFLHAHVRMPSASAAASWLPDLSLLVSRLPEWVVMLSGAAPSIEDVPDSILAPFNDAIAWMLASSATVSALARGLTAAFLYDRALRKDQREEAGEHED